MKRSDIAGDVNFPVLSENHKSHISKMSALKIPYDQLSPEPLQGVIEKFVTRDGI